MSSKRPNSRRHNRGADDSLPSCLVVLPSDILWDAVLGFLDIHDHLHLALTCRCIYYSRVFWTSVLSFGFQSHESRRVGHHRRFRKPRRVVYQFLHKRMCTNCRALESADIRITYRGRLERYRICRQCVRLPQFRDIQYTDAVAKYGLSRRDLAMLPSRQVRFGMGYRRFFHELDVWNLATRLGKTPTMIKISTM
ncbi:unnamed protein product [Aphanomyces euteiches]|uniref:F-box domain-containing protein n=1 Tax=Aphanomyces euteiches TaxID=100861 RepID=A0A6G0XED5_9STRA|nr:hypothetical protein Ae201684_005525 [Aphanomyces euteiches]KAH9078402.1 hypothetical protein Ae201684P_019491 [Aphanomyces euteiches]KAH9154339.1 hypothetical protein AeRB84_003553 [Aphanomyces euteiches]